MLAKFTKILSQFFPQKAPSDPNAPAQQATGIPMKFPYTFSAKLAQFPYMFHFNNAWIYKYYIYALIACTPVFAYIQKKSYSPANVAYWEEFRRKEIEEAEKRFD